MGLSILLCFVLAGAAAQLALSLGGGMWIAALVGLVALVGCGLPVIRAERTDPVAGSPRELDLPARHALALALGLTAVGLAVRAYRLTALPVWDDEMWTLRNFYTDDWGELLRVAFDDYWPPLYYLILNALGRVADTSVLWLRLPSVVFGGATVLAVFFAGRTILRNERGAVVASALIAGAVSHVLYSQEARVYALQVLLVVLSCQLFYRSYWERRISLGFLAVTTLLTYTHSFASWYIISAQSTYVVVAWWLWRDVEALKRGFISQVLVVALWIPLVVAFAWARFSRQIVVPTFWATGSDGLPGLDAWVVMYQMLAVRSWTGAALFGTLMIAGTMAGLRAWRSRGRRDGAAASAAMQTDSREQSAAEPVVFLLLWCTVPLAFSYVVTALSPMDTFAATGNVSRYHLGVMPGMCLLAGAGVAYARGRSLLPVTVAIVGLLAVVELPRHFREFSRAYGMDVAAQVVREQRVEPEPIYVGGGFRVFAYYYRGTFPRIGSREWDAMVEATKADSLQYTMESGKWGDTYAYEKIPAAVRSFANYNRYEGPEAQVRFVAGELARGLLSDRYWLVLREPMDQKDRYMLDALAGHGVDCPDPDIFHAPGLTVRRCNPNRRAP